LSEIILTFEDIDLAELVGQMNSNLKLFKDAFPEVQFTSRGNNIKLVGEKKDTQRAKGKLETIARILRSNKKLTKADVTAVVNGNEAMYDDSPTTSSENKTIVHGRDGKSIKARTVNQKKLVDLSDRNDIVFAIGPAGTGKTYTAVALAVRALKNRLVKKIILTRPAVEAGENLGFLPGDLKDKIDPYLRPLYDALDDMLPIDKLQYFMTNRVIEVAPLAFMRGRTLDNAFVILDEAQNATSVQIKMFLTRLGPSAKCIITGDLTQIDLPRHMKSGLFTALDILPSIDGVGLIRLQSEDVVRHRLVKAIIDKYADFDEERKKQYDAKEEPPKTKSE
jgi:phosphate starvation-inducible protein PhoH and related proteins